MPTKRRGSFSQRGWSPHTVPAGPVEVNWDHPLAAGLLSLYLPGLTGRDFCGLGGTLVAASGSSPVVGTIKHGPAAMGGTSANRALTAPASNLQSKITTAGSILWVGDDPASGSDHSVNAFGYTPNQGGIAPWHFVAIGYFFGKFSFLLANSNDGDVNNFDYGLVPTTALVCSAAFKVTVGTSTAITGYMNGAQSFNTTSNRTTAINYTAAPTLEVHSPGARSSGANTSLGALWNRTLTNDEQAWSHSEPFVLFRPVVRRNYFVPPAFVIYTDSIIESGSAADTNIGLAIFRDTLAMESVTASDTNIGLVILRDTLATESVTVADSNTNQINYTASSLETGSATDSIISLATFNNSTLESGTAADFNNDSILFNDTFVETSTATESIDYQTLFSDTITETVTVTDNASDSIIVTASISESGSVADINSNIAVFTEHFDESGFAADNFGLQGNHFADTVDESLSLNEIIVDRLIASDSINEIYHTIDMNTSVLSITDSIFELSNVTETISNRYIANDTVLEAANVTETIINRFVGINAVIETGNLNDHWFTDQRQAGFSGGSILVPGRNRTILIQGRNRTILIPGRNV